LRSFINQSNISIWISEKQNWEPETEGCLVLTTRLVMKHYKSTHNPQAADTCLSNYQSHTVSMIVSCSCKQNNHFVMLSIPLCIIIHNKNIHQLAVQHNYLLKQIYNICGGNMFRLLSAIHHQALHSFLTRIWRSWAVELTTRHMLINTWKKKTWKSFRYLSSHNSCPHWSVLTCIKKLFELLYTMLKK
jgi:predicted transcriptional regulator